MMTQDKAVEELAAEYRAIGYPSWVSRYKATMEVKRLLHIEVKRIEEERSKT